MSLSPETKIINFERSIKSYFINHFETAHGVKCFFDWLDDTPVDDVGVKLHRWVVVYFGEISDGTVNSARVEIHLFTRLDDEGAELTKLLDILNDALYDDADVGLKAIPLYNTEVDPWIHINGILPYKTGTYRTMYAKDDTKIKTVRLSCKWGGK